MQGCRDDVLLSWEMSCWRPDETRKTTEGTGATVWWLQCTGKNFSESSGSSKQLIANVHVSARSIIQCYLGAQDAPVPLWYNLNQLGPLAHVFLWAQIWIHQFRIGQSEKQTHCFAWPVQVVVSPAYQRRNSKFDVLYYGHIRQSFKRLKVTISHQVAY